MADMHTPLKPAQGYFASLGWESLDGKDVFVGHAVFDAPPKWPVNVVWDQTPMVFKSADAPSQDAETIKALEAQIATKDAALRDADYALSNLIDGFEFDDDDPDGPCQAEELCGNRMCEECGCLKDKRDAARAALAGSAS